MTKARKKSARKDKTIITEISVEALDRLMKDYGIEAGDYRRLAARLAIDYKPGFPKFKLEHGTYGKVMRDKGGRPTEWSPDKLDKLITDVDRVKKEHGFTNDDDALKHLTKAGDWARPPKRDDSNKWIKRLKNELGRERRVRRYFQDWLKRKTSNPEN